MDLYDTRVFQVGEKVKARECHNYSVSKDKIYTVTGYRGVCYADTGFRYDPLVQVINNFGKPVFYHTWVFEKLDELPKND